MAQKAMKTHAGNIVVWSYSKLGNSGTKRSEGRDHGVPKEKFHCAERITRSTDKLVQM